MVTRAIARYIRITPRKFRQIIPFVKGRNPEEAIAILANVNKRASIYAIELLKSAVANAKRVEGIDASTLYISHIVANPGPQLKRFRAASMGRASQIRKRTSHIVIELDTRSAQAPAAAEAHAAKAVAAKPVVKEKKVTPKKAAPVKAAASKKHAKHEPKANK